MAGTILNRSLMLGGMALLTPHSPEGTYSKNKLAQLCWKKAAFCVG
jgi:hypothetical protein